MKSEQMYKLYSMQRSGNSYKVRLALALLKAPYLAIVFHIVRGQRPTPDFLAKNPSGQVPLLEVAEGRHLAESNAILWYVCGGTPLAPESRVERAEALQWMFFEQHALEPNIGAAYFWLSLVKGGRDLQTHALEDWMERGYAALQVMENHLKTHQYFAAQASSPSPISRCTATPTSPTAATTIWRPSRRSAPGCGGSSRPRVFSWTMGLASRRPRSTRPPALPPGLDRPAGAEAKTPQALTNTGSDVNLCGDLAIFQARTAPILPAAVARLFDFAGDSPAPVRI